MEETPNRPYLYAVGMTRMLNFSHTEFVFNGGFIMYDISNPLVPKAIANYSDYYIHDLTVQKCGNRYLLVAAHIEDDKVSIIDVTDYNNISVVRTFDDRYSVAHNVVFDATCEYLVRERDCCSPLFFFFFFFFRFLPFFLCFFFFFFLLLVIILFVIVFDS